MVEKVEEVEEVEDIMPLTQYPISDIRYPIS